MQSAAMRQQNKLEERAKKKAKKAERRQGPMDTPFLLLVVLIFAIGLIMMFSASYASAYYTQSSSAYFFVKQGLIGAAGIVIMLIISRVNYQFLRPLSLVVLLAAIVLMAMVPFFGVIRNGAKRWLNLFGLEFQPSEVAKFAIILTFSTMISVFKEKMRTFKYGILPFAIILAVMAGLMILQKHVSGLILIVAVGGALMFVGGIHWAWLAAAVASAAGAFFVIITQMSHSLARVQIWLDPFSDPQGDGYQTIQSLYAVGSGGLFGVGLGKSRQKHLYLPEQHNDFVFAIVCEEPGFVGAALVLALFALLIIRGYWIAIRSRDRFGSLLATGIITLFAMQVFLNIAVVTNLIPVTGISLPFFSYGGTSLVIQLAEMGIILSVSRQIPARPAG